MGWAKHDGWMWRFEHWLFALANASLWTISSLSHIPDVPNLAPCPLCRRPGWLDPCCSFPAFTDLSFQHFQHFHSAYQVLFLSCSLCTPCGLSSDLLLIISICLLDPPPPLFRPGWRAPCSSPLAACSWHGGTLSCRLCEPNS